MLLIEAWYVSNNVLEHYTCTQMLTLYLYIRNDKYITSERLICTATSGIINYKCLMKNKYLQYGVETYNACKS